MKLSLLTRRLMAGVATAVAAPASFQQAELRKWQRMVKSTGIELL